MGELNIEEIARKKDKLEFITEYREAENKRIYKKDITPERQKEILEAMGIADGNIFGNQRFKSFFRFNGRLLCFQRCSFSGLFRF